LAYLQEKLDASISARLIAEDPRLSQGYLMATHVKLRQIGLEEHMDFNFSSYDSFKLLEVFEVKLDINGWIRCIRYEIFSSIKEVKKYRARVYIDEQYNLYPYLLNSTSDNNGVALNKHHSVDMINRDITTLLPIGEELAIGKIWLSLDEFMSYLHPQVMSFVSEMNQT
jgi:hypothetical protein